MEVTDPALNNPPDPSYGSHGRPNIRPRELCASGLSTGIALIQGRQFQIVRIACLPVKGARVG